MSAGKSPFLDRPPSDWVASNQHAFALRDAYAVSPGHTLIIPKRLVSTWFDASRTEQIAILELIDLVKEALDEEHSPDGYNIGINSGAAAGQTVMHLHVHVIPRYLGDMPDPRGGVRGVIPSRQKYATLEGIVARDSDGGPYLATARGDALASLPRFVPGENQPFVDALRSAILQAETIDFVSAFVQPSGLLLLHGDLLDALSRGASLRILTGDYLAITSADALVTLLSLAEEHERCEVRMREVGPGTSFHPKAYIFSHGPQSAAFIGSSNLSKTALTHGIEWNLRIISSASIADRETLDRIRERFDQLWNAPETTQLTKPWIDDYRARAPVPAPPQPEPRPEPPTPHIVQEEVLKRLCATRREGHSAGLVVLATGLGKTFLSAFDFRQMRGRRALFVAHREEILGQARQAWAKVFPDLVLGILAGGKYETEVDVLFASVQTLSREQHHTRFPIDHFDYVVVDEFHHAAASSYRRLLRYFEPKFLLGLTATPDRTDGASLRELCDDNLVHNVNLVAGITHKLLVPFRYFGVQDRLDFTPIPWRSGRFEPERLTRAVETRARAEQALEEYLRRAQTSNRRTLVFCVSQTHADYMAAFFRESGCRAASVHSGPTSAPRARSLRDLESGKLEMVCAVDVFNEGLDVPAINTVLMLRPTASPIVFLQQIGRGLRPAPGKEHLTIVDFIGNHRTFLQRPQALAYLTGREATGYEAVRVVAEGQLKLPAGCSVEVETAAIDLLRQLASRSTSDTIDHEYAVLRDTHGRRPRATELLRALGAFRAVNSRYTTYFDLVSEQEDLSEDEARVLGRHRTWFSDLSKTAMSKSFRMVCLAAMLAADALPGEMRADDNARDSDALIRRTLLLFREMQDDSSDRTKLDAAFVKKWRKMPLNVWARGDGTTQKWFALDGEVFRCTIEVAPEDRDEFAAMSAELVELRLAEHLDRLRRRQPTASIGAPVALKVSHAGGRPILRYDRQRQPDIPGPGEINVSVDGTDYEFHFRKIAVNKAVEPGSDANVLSQLIRGWYGPTAGHPGTKRSAFLEKTERGYRLRPEEGETVLSGLSSLTEIPYFEDMKVACGAFEYDDRLEGASRWIYPDTDIELSPNQHFVVQASGHSMDGGERPIRDGALVLCAWFDGRSADEVEGSAALLMGVQGNALSFAALKVPRRIKNRWWLESWNPEFPSEAIEAGMKLEPIGRVLGVVQERTELVLWAIYRREEVARVFGRDYSAWWRAGHRDLDVNGAPQSVLFVTLDKGGEIRRAEHYQDRFLSPHEFQWESPNNVDETMKQGKSIIQHEAQGRVVHLFVRLVSKVKSASQPFLYCGPVRYLRHKGGKPMRVWFEMENALPKSAWRVWGRSP